MITDGSCNVTSSYKNLCLLYLGEWSGNKCSIKKEFLCGAVLGGVWSNPPPSGESNCLVSTTITETDCTTASSGTWNSTDKYCTTSIDTDPECVALGGTWSGSCDITKAIITKNKLCEFFGGNWNSTGNICTQTAKNQCQANGGVWDVGSKAVRLKLNGTLSSNTQQINEEGQNQLVTFDFAISRIPMGEISVGIYYDTDSDLTYRGQCIDTNDHANFTEANCIHTDNAGHWFDDGTEQFCSGLTESADCTGTASPQLGGTLTPEIQLNLYPSTTLPVINW